MTLMCAKGYSFEVITDIGSCINYNKKGLNLLMDLLTNSEVEKIIVLYKDRLIRFEYELFQIVTVISCRLQGKRANKAKKMIKELAENDPSEEN